MSTDSDGLLGIAGGDLVPGDRHAMPCVGNQVPAATDAMSGGDHAMPAADNPMLTGRVSHAVPGGGDAVSAIADPVPGC